MELLQAFNQWRTRPDDERFDSLAQLQAATLRYGNMSTETTVQEHEISAVVIDRGINRDLGLRIGNSEKEYRFSNSGFRQLSTQIGAPPSYLSKLPHELAAKNINHGIMNRAGERSVILLTGEDDNILARSFTTQKYNRIWNYEIADRIENLSSKWQVPPARPVSSNQKGSRLATEDDVLSNNRFALSIKVGDTIAPAGLYASDKDMFVFMVNEDRGIQAGNELLYRGFFISNNEIGEGSLVITTFLYNTVCGNHICWGVSNVNEHRIKHFGSANKRWDEAWKSIVNQSDIAASLDREMINKAKLSQIGKNKEEVVDYIYSKRIQVLGKKKIEKAYDTAVEYECDHGAPNSIWAMIMGLTRNSQESPFADERNIMDRAASSLLKFSSK